jgi:hypothetical protein
VYEREGEKIMFPVFRKVSEQFPDFREHLFEKKFFVSKFGRKKYNFSVSFSETGTGKSWGLHHTQLTSK